MDPHTENYHKVKSMAFSEEDRQWMIRALREAQKAFDEGEIPIGAVLVSDTKLLSACHNQVEQLADATAHAEMLALTAAMSSLGTKYLSHATLYVTLEPCVMCMGAIRWTQISRVVYGATESRFGYRRQAPTSPHPSCIVECGLMEEECRELVQRFFRQQRETRKK